MNTENKTHGREYLTVLLRRRSIIALCCEILILALSFYSIIESVNMTFINLNENAFVSFTYFTLISNTLAALSTAFVLPFAVEGIRKKRFVLPKWVAAAHFVAAVSIAYVMVFVLAFISWASPADAFGGPNTVTHVICPFLIVISFFQIENGHIFTWKDRLLGIVPFGIYTAVYYIEVVLIGESNGGWPDLYHVQEHLPAAVAIPVSLILCFGVSTAVALISNRITKRRNEKTFLNWSGDLDPVEVRIEAFAIGRMAGQCSEANNVQIPYDILLYLAKRYGLSPEDLMKPFVKGLMTELKDRESPS